MQARLVLTLILMFASGRAVRAQADSTRPSIAGQESAFTGTITLKGDTVLQRLGVYIHFSEPILAVRIERQDGKIVSEPPIPGGPSEEFSASIPLAALESGVYYVHAVASSGYMARKFEVRK